MCRSSEQAAISVGIVEDNGTYRNLLCNLCNDSKQLRLAAACSSMQAACDLLVQLEPDVVLVDLGLPDGDGTEIVRHLRRAGSRSECLVLTVYDDDRHLFAALEAGAVGYVLKDQMDATALTGAIQEIMQGGAPMSASIARRVLGHFHESVRRKTATSVLTERENEVMEKLAQGYSARKISQLLHISYETVRCHQKNIYKKLHVNSVLEALAALNTLPRVANAAPATR